MTESDEAAIEVLLGELVAAWNRGDAQAFGARYRADRTFTNVNGALYVGRRGVPTVATRRSSRDTCGEPPAR
jgi:uncharacterized protein (TIGR02246 family)